MLPEVDANNSVAWRIRLWMLLESEEYAEVVLNTNRLSSMPASNETAELYLMCSLAHMKTGVKDTGLELYQTAINIDSIKARKCIGSIGEDNKMIIYKTLLEKASQLHRNMTSLSTKDSVDMLNYYSEIWRLCPNDINSAEIYGQLLMKVRMSIVFVKERCKSRQNKVIMKYKVDHSPMFRMVSILISMIFVR